MQYADLLGLEFLFYGVDAHLFKIDDLVIEAVEDPNDGLRSSLVGEPRVCERGAGLFFREPVAIVAFRNDQEERCSGFSLYDEEHDHTWLRFGTDNSDDCYPLFYFRYEPLKNYTVKRKRAPMTYVDPNHADRFFEERQS